MSEQFKKVAAARPKPVRKKKRPAVNKLPASDDASKTPVTRVGDGRDHHDTLSTKVLYVLVDQPTAPEESVAFDQGFQKWPIAFTTAAEPLYDTTLVFALPIEHVADTGPCTLKLERSASSVELFAGIDTKDLMLDDYISSSKALPSLDGTGNQRMLDFTTVKARPPYDDKTLDQKAPPHSSLGSQEEKKD